MANQEKVEQAVYQLLEALGENPEREGLLDTPKRVAKMYAEMFSGLNEDPKDQFTAVFSEAHDEVVLVKERPFGLFAKWRQGDRTFQISACG